MQERARDVQLLRVTKDLQLRLNEDGQARRDQHDAETLEKTLELNEKVRKIRTRDGNIAARPVGHVTPNLMHTHTNTHARYNSTIVENVPNAHTHKHTCKIQQYNSRKRSMHGLIIMGWGACLHRPTRRRFARRSGSSRSSRHRGRRGGRRTGTWTAASWTDRSPCWRGRLQRHWQVSIKVI